MTITITHDQHTHARCVDGKFSTSTGAGTCSGHGGVDCVSPFSKHHVICQVTASPTATVTATASATASAPATTSASATQSAPADSPTPQDTTSTSISVSTAPVQSLPVTGGGDGGALAASGGLLLALGVGAMYVARRRYVGRHR